MKNKENSHSRYAPSSFPAWACCPRYRARRIDVDSASARAGAEAHVSFSEAISLGHTGEDPAVCWAYAEMKTLAGNSEIKSEFTIYPGNSAVPIEMYGTADAVWRNGNEVCIADFKTFSTGDVDYFPQLMAYAALYFSDGLDSSDGVVNLYVLHGGVRKVESLRTTFSECLERTLKIIDSLDNGIEPPRICKHCQWCANSSWCPAASKAVATVNSGNVAWHNMSLCKKLVLLDAVDKLSASIRKEARKVAEENGGVLEMDGIRYELKPWAGKATVKNIVNLANGVRNPKILRVNERKQEANEVQLKGLNSDEFLALCEISKTKIIEALKEKNKCITKADITRFIEIFYENKDGSPHFVRTI